MKAWFVRKGSDIAPEPLSGDKGYDPDKSYGHTIKATHKPTLSFACLDWIQMWDWAGPEQ